MDSTKPRDIDEYISGFPDEVQRVLQTVRTAIREAAPDAGETISYAIPTFTLNKTNLVHFAGFKNHVGFYPAPTGGEAFKEELSGYKTGKGSVQFPLSQPMPLELIGKIVRFRVKEVLEKGTKKKLNKKV